MDVLLAETEALKAAVQKRKVADDFSRQAEMELRMAIKAASERGLAASYISDATGLTQSRLYQIFRDRRI